MSHEKYLEHETLSAPPQKLQLLLIEAALRRGQRAKMCWATENEDGARKAIEQMQAIAVQLLNGLSPTRNLPLVQRVAAIYSFINRELAKARLQRDESALNGVMRVLETERETWWQVCQQLNAATNTGPTGTPHFAQFPDSISASSFSLDA